MFGSIIRGIGKGVKYAGPALGGFMAGGPAGAGLAIVAQVSGGGAKKHGQQMEKGGAPAVHKATAPIAAVGAPMAITGALSAFGVNLPLDQLGSFLCASGELSAMARVGLSSIPGIIALVSHTFGHGLQGATASRR